MCIQISLLVILCVSDLRKAFADDVTALDRKCTSAHWYPEYSDVRTTEKHKSAEWGLRTPFCNASPAIRVVLIMIERIVLFTIRIIFAKFI